MNKETNPLDLFKKIPPQVWILSALIAGYFIYAFFTNPLLRFVAKGFIHIIPLFLKLFLALLKYFAILFVLQIIFCKTIKNKAYRNVIWLSVIVITSILDEIGLFGNFSWNPLKIHHSFEYLLVQMQILAFYYVIIVTLLPKWTWGYLSSLFIIMLSLISSGVSLIPIVGSLLGSLIAAIVTFSIFSFFLLNVVATMLLWVEKKLS